MYSRATPFERSDKVIGTHQKIDRAARLILREAYADIFSENIDEIFPRINQILKFEGKNGPDGIKLKSPGKDEPWHFVDPHGDLSQILDYVENHIHNLAKAITENDEMRASFEAAWLAHAITDALTPAHQYPMEEKIVEISGKLPSERDKVYKKIFLSGENIRQKVKNNWEYIGPKGVMSSHMLYEMGIATLISPIAPRRLILHGMKNEIKELSSRDFQEVLIEKIEFVSDLQHFERFMQRGWTNSLARETKEILLPEIVGLVALSWLDAIIKARK